MSVKRGKAAQPKRVERSKPGKTAARKPEPPPKKKAEAKAPEPTKKKAAAKAPPPPKKAEPKKVEAKKAEPKKVEARKAEPKKVEAPKAEPKKAEAPKAEPKKAEAKKVEKKKVEAKKVEPKVEAKPPEPKRPEPKPAPEAEAPKRPARTAPKRQEKSETRAKEEPMPMTPKPAPAPAVPEAKRAVLRVAGGLRTPNKRKAKPGAIAPVGRSGNGQGDVQGKLHAPKIEINPKLQRAKDVLKNPAPPPPTPPGGKPMSVAQKNRAAAEAAFAKVTANGASPSPPAPVPAAAPSPAVAPAPTGPQQVFGARINERDTITTSLRLARTREETMDAAVQLADRYRLPPDQTLLLKVVELGDPRLTKLGLEELLELEDRGRVRGTPELRAALHAMRSNDPETMELRDLLLAKLGDAPRVS